MMAGPNRTRSTVAAPFRILVLLLALVALAAGAAAAFVLTLDPEDYREDIITGVRDSIGLDLRLDGAIELTLWPSFSFEIEDVAADWEDATDDPLMAIRRMRLALPLLPLVSGGTAAVEAIVLEGVELDMRIAADGGENWAPPSAREADVGDPVDASDPQQPDPDSQNTSASASQTSFDIELDQLEVVDLRVRFRDARSDTDIDLSGLDFVIRSEGEAFVGALGGRLDMQQGPHIAFEGDFRGDKNLAWVEIVDLTAELELPGWPRSLPVRMTGRTSRTDERADLENLRIEIGELTLLSSGTIGLGDAQTLDLRLDIPPSDLRALLLRSGYSPTTANPQALTALSGALTITGVRSDLRFAPIELNLDALALTGTARVSGTDLQAIEFDLDAGRLDLTPYVSAADEPTPDTAPSPTVPLVNDEALGLDALKALNLSGAVSADALVMPGLEIGAGRIEISAESGRLDARLSADGVYGGNIELNADLNVEGSTPEVGLRMNAASIDPGQIAPGAGFSGRLEMNGQLDATGESSAALAQALRGRIDLTGSPGTLDVASLKQMLLPLATLLGQPDEITDWPDQISYQTLSGAWQVLDGTSDQSLEMAIDNLRLDAKGGISLATGVFDFRSGALFSATTPRTFDVPRDLDGIRLPARCAGRMNEPGNPCGFDQAATGPLIQQIIAGRAGDKLRERLSDQLPDNLRGPADALLRGLFGGQRSSPEKDNRP